MTDPRLAVLGERLAGINRIIAVTGGKGGIGKTVIATTTALILKGDGFTCGLCDLDFCGPTTHIVLGVEGVEPHEDKGIVPPQVCGIKYLSVVFFSQDKPTPLRGTDISNAIIELLAITRWGNLDVLVIDMPPGLSDPALDLVRFIPNAEYLVVTTSSRLAWVTTQKVVQFIKSLGLPIIGVIENLAFDGPSFVQSAVERFNLPYLGRIEFDPSVEDALGDPHKLLATRFATQLSNCIDRILD